MIGGGGRGETMLRRALTFLKGVTNEGTAQSTVIRCARGIEREKRDKKRRQQCLYRLCLVFGELHNCNWTKERKKMAKSSYGTKATCL